MEIESPEFTELVLCEKNSIRIRGRIRIIEYELFTHAFYLCERDDCKEKMSCIYKFPEEWYWCHLCNTSGGFPLFKLNPKSRLCRNCGAVIIDNIFANARLEGLRK